MKIYNNKVYKNTTLFSMLVYSIFMSITLNVHGLGNTSLNKPKGEVIQDQVTFGLYFPAINNWQGFQVSYSNDPLEVATNNKLIFGVPYMGHYRGEGYNFRKRLGLINFDPNMLTRSMPNTLGVALAQQLNTPEENLADALASKKIVFSSIILGTVLEPANDSSNNTYNLIYHAWAGSFVPQRKGNHMGFFNINAPMGVFSADGASVVAIPKVDAIAFNTFSPKGINWHHPQHLSPNNARISINAGRAFSTFWAAAVSPDKANVSITYFLTANTPQSEEWLAQILNKSRTIQELSNNISPAIARSGWLSDQDKDTLQNWLNTIITTLGAQKAVSAVGTSAQHTQSALPRDQEREGEELEQALLQIAALELEEKNARKKQRKEEQARLLAKRLEEEQARLSASELEEEQSSQLIEQMQEEERLDELSSLLAKQLSEEQ